MKATLSVSMIVKNEERHLSRLLDNLGIFAEEIIVLDTGSTDRTRQIAIERGAIVHDFEWCDDFAKARNASLAHCTKDFVIWLDADDVITSEDANKLRDVLSSPPAWDVLYLPYLYDASKRKRPPRIFRNRIGIKWIYPIHEILQFPNNVRRNRDIDDICIYHKPLREYAANSGRNLRILLKAVQDPEYIDSNYMYWHIAKEYSGLRDPQRAMHYFEEAIKRTAPTDPFIMSREHIGLGKQHRRVGQVGLAAEVFAKGALHYPTWREPYCGVADCLWELGEADAARECVLLAASIHDHRLGIERMELYDEQRFNELYLSKAMQPVERGIPVRPLSDKPKRLVAGGDVCLARQMAGYVSKYGYGWPLRSLWPVLQTADISLVNLECVLSNCGEALEKDGRRPFYFRGLPQLLDVLSAAGVNVVTTANNHAMDFGAEALRQQTALLKETCFAVCGSGNDVAQAAAPCYLNAGGTLVAVIGIHTESSFGAAGPTSPGVNHAHGHFQTLARLLPALAEARNRADVVIVSPHWGPNWRENPADSTRQLAHTLINLGADAILGHSAHIVQGVEIYKGHPIVYDMGSLLFDRVNENRIRLSALWELEFDQDGVRKLIIRPVLLEPGRALPAPPAVADEILQLIQRLSIELGEFAGKIENRTMVVECAPAKRAWSRSMSPVDVHGGKSTRRVPVSFHGPPSNLVLEDAPVWADCQLNEDVIFLGCRIPPRVRPGQAFSAEVLLRVAGPLQGRWEGRITVCSAAGKVAYTWVHPIADGACPASEWKPGTIVLNRTWVRPPRVVPQGTYSLQFDFVERDTGKTFCPLTKGRTIRGDQLVLSNLEVTVHGRPGATGTDGNEVDSKSRRVRPKPQGKGKSEVPEIAK